MQHGAFNDFASTMAFFWAYKVTGYKFDTMARARLLPVKRQRIEK